MATEEIRVVGSADMTQLLQQLGLTERGFNKLQNRMRLSMKDWRNVDAALEITGLKMSGLNKHLKMNFLEMKEGGKVVNKLTGQMQSYGQVIGQAAIKGRRFKFEWLGIMFAGMALDRAFGGLVRTQMQLFGVTDMLSGAWTIVLLPIMQLITPLIYKLIDAFMNLSPGMQMAIGAGVLFMAVLGKVMLVGGQLMLLFYALKGLGVSLFGKLGAASAVFVSALGPILIVIGAIILIIVAVWLAWKSNFMNIRADIRAFIAHFKATFRGMINFIKGILKIIRGIFTGDFELVRKGIIQAFKGAISFIYNAWKALSKGMVIITKGAMKLIYNFIKVIIDAVIWVASKVKKFFGGKEISWRMPKFQTGGLVTRTGPAILHAGERVIPKGRATTGVMFAPTVYIDATIDSDMDVRMLASKLNEYWAKDFERIAQGRGII